MYTESDTLPSASLFPLAYALVFSGSDFCCLLLFGIDLNGVCKNGKLAACINWGSIILCWSSRIETRSMLMFLFLTFFKWSWFIWNWPWNSTLDYPQLMATDHSTAISYIKTCIFLSDALSQQSLWLFFINGQILTVNHIKLCH